MTSLARKSVLTTVICLLAILSLDLWVHGRMAAEVAAHLHLHAPQPLEHPFWDSEPYAVGIDRYRAGRSPYTLDDLDNPLPFAYPPAFVWVGAGLAQVLPAPWGWRLYIAINLLSLALLELILAALLLGPVRGRQWVALACLAPLASIMSTIFLSGNIHVVWYAAALVAAIPGVRDARWGWFQCVAFLAGVNQPVFLTLLLVPVFLGRRQYVQSTATVIATSAVYAGEWLFAHDMYSRFEMSIANHLAASHDFGEGVFGIAARLPGLAHLPARYPALALQVFFSLTIYGTLLWLGSRLTFRTRLGDRRWWALIALAVVLVNPRIMPYDAALGLIPAVYLFLYGLRPRWQLAIILPVVLVSVALHRQVGFTLVLTAAFAVGAWQLSGKRLFDGPIVGDGSDVRAPRPSLAA